MIHKPSQIRSYFDNTFRIPFTYDNNIWESKNDERELAYTISESAFSNIRDFKYVYFTNGITEFINYVASTHKLKIYQNEYRYLNLFRNVSTETGNILYLSYPFSGSGLYSNIPENIPVILDCAYIFASDMSGVKILPDNVTHVSFSLSKSHNLSDMRIGWVFSKTKIEHYHILQYDNAYTINGNIKPVLELVSAYSPNYLYLKHKESLSKLLRDNELKENSTNLFGISNSGMRVPFYDLLPSNIDATR